MRGISEEFLKVILDDGNDQYKMSAPYINAQKKVLQALINQCKELNPWLPIENAPKDESEILLFVPGCYGCEIGRWNMNSDSWSCHPYVPTHYQELPDDPKE